MSELVRQMLIKSCDRHFDEAVKSANFAIMKAGHQFVVKQAVAVDDEGVVDALKRVDIGKPFALPELPFVIEPQMYHWKWYVEILQNRIRSDFEGFLEGRNDLPSGLSPRVYRDHMTFMWFYWSPALSPCSRNGQIEIWKEGKDWKIQIHGLEDTPRTWMPGAGAQHLASNMISSLVHSWGHEKARSYFDCIMPYTG